MFLTEILETLDRSYYADKLKELTGRPRNYWTGISISQLQNYLRQLLRKEKRKVRGNQISN